MQLAKSILVAIGLAAGLLLLSCGGDKGRKQEAAPAEQVGADSVTAYVDLRERGYAGLEPVPMKLVVRNETERTLRFTFPTEQRFDFVVTKVKEPVWAWSEGRTFSEDTGHLSIAPGDSLIYEYTWDGRKADGSLPRLGRYRVKGVLMTAPPIETGTGKFAVVD